jgi:DNA-binding LacI/PurR family transcriptional regulator
MDSPRRNVQVLSSLLDEIRGRAWAPGTRLPDERRQCDRLRVSRTTLRRGLSYLERHGIIERRQGAGTFLRTIPSDSLSRKILDEVGVERALVPPPRRSLRFAFLHDWPSIGPALADTLTGVCRFAGERDHLVVVGNAIAPHATGSRRFAQRTFEPDADGLILMATLRPEDVAIIQQQVRVPYVLLTSMPLPNAVVLNRGDMCRQGVIELVGRGHRTIWVLEAGWRGMGVRPEVSAAVTGLHNEWKLKNLECLAGADGIDRLLRASSRPSAIVVLDDVFCAHVCEQLSAAGVKIGRDIEIITQANLGINPGLPPTVWRMEFDLIGYGALAAQQLERMLLEGGQKRFAPIHVSATYRPASGSPSSAGAVKKHNKGKS